MIIGLVVAGSLAGTVTLWVLWSLKKQDLDNSNELGMKVYLFVLHIYIRKKASKMKKIK